LIFAPEVPAITALGGNGREVELAYEQHVLRQSPMGEHVHFFFGWTWTWTALNFNQSAIKGEMDRSVWLCLSPVQKLK